MSKLDRQIAVSDIYKVGHATLVIIQFVSMLGMGVFGVLLIWSLGIGAGENTIKSIVFTSIPVVLWRWSTKKLEAVGDNGDSYFSAIGGDE